MLVGLRTLVRSARLLVHIVTGILVSTAVNLDFTGRLRPEPIARFWSRRLLRILNIELIVHGQRARGATVTAANHVSWLDIPVISTGDQCQFIAKSEIRHWPVAGSLARAAGTFYLRRGKGGAKPLIEALVPHLSNGGSVVLFPEGTTTDGQQVLPFHARLFSAALDANAQIQPLALRYGPARDGRLVAPFIGNDDLVRHILRLLREPALRVDMHYCTPFAASGLDRAAVALRAEQAVRQTLGLAVASRPLVGAVPNCSPALAA
ncbi:MAG: 1-acyl-sn-glycerol-3-phosphate acyltransferase [Pseudomonadota bacterium]|nr:1-acyl-sn-glycerol-3-phosphate acyltransferase [Pseudomonadota bacterium]